MLSIIPSDELAWLDHRKDVFCGKDWIFSFLRAGLKEGFSRQRMDSVIEGLCTAGTEEFPSHLRRWSGNEPLTCNETEKGKPFLESTKCALTMGLSSVNMVHEAYFLAKEEKKSCMYLLGSPKYRSFRICQSSREESLCWWTRFRSSSQRHGHT